MAGYCLRRWRFGEFFRVPGSSCRIEALAFRTANRLHRAVVINTVTRWRIMLMNRHGHQMHSCGARLTCSDHELILPHNNHAQQYGLVPGDDFGAAIALVADLGGCRARRHEPEPGDRITSHGYGRLSNAAPGTGR